MLQLIGTLIKYILSQDVPSRFAVEHKTVVTIIRLENIAIAK